MRYQPTIACVSFHSLLHSAATKTSLLLVLALLSCVFSFSQNKTIDSLQKVLSTAKKDSNRIKILLQLNYNYRLQNNPAKAMEVANEALSLANALSDGKWQGTAYQHKGFSAQLQQKTDDALQCFQLALQCFQETKDEMQASLTLFYTGGLYAQLQNNTEALKYYQLALQGLQQIKDKFQARQTHKQMVQWYASPQNSAEALKYLQLALQSFQSIKNRSQEAQALDKIAMVYTWQQNYPEALRYYQLALKSFQSINDKQQVGWTFFRMAQVYFWQQNNPEAIKYYFKAYGMFEELKNKSNMAKCLIQIGRLNQITGNFDEAIQEFSRSLSLFEQLNDKEGILSALDPLQEMRWVQKRFGDAIEINLRSLQIAQSLDKRDDLVVKAKSGLGVNYGELGDVASAAGDSTTAAVNFSKAVPLLTEVLQAREKGDDPYALAATHWGLGNLYLKMKKYDLAEQHFQKSLVLATPLRYETVVSADHEELAEMYKQTGNYKKAYEYYKLYMNGRDTMMWNDKDMRKVAEAKGRYEAIKKEDSLKFEQQLSSEKLKRQQLLAIQQAQELQLKEASLKLSNQQKELSDLAFLRTQAELKAEQSQRQKKEKQLTLAEKEKALQQVNLRLKTTELSLKGKEVAAQKTQQNVLFGGAAVLGALAFVLYRNKQQKQQTKNFLEKQRLRTQIASDLHDEIGSTLTSISFFSEAVKMQVPEGAGNTHYMLDKIGANARTVVSTMKDIVWVINPNNDVSESLASRIKSHLAEQCNGRNIQYKFDTDEAVNGTSLDLQQRKNIYLVYKEAVHNAVKYANCSQITVNLSRSNGSIKLRVEDNGTGFDPETVEEGNGLANMKRRAGEIGADFTVDTAAGKGTAVELSVKITESGDGVS